MLPTSSQRHCLCVGGLGANQNIGVSFHLVAQRWTASVHHVVQPLVDVRSDADADLRALYPCEVSTMQWMNIMMATLMKTGRKVVAA